MGILDTKESNGKIHCKTFRFNHFIMIDLYDLLTTEERATVSQIALEAMTREGLTPNVWELHIAAELET